MRPADREGQKGGQASQPWALEGTGPSPVHSAGSLHSHGNHHGGLGQGGPGSGCYRAPLGSHSPCNFTHYIFPTRLSCVSSVEGRSFPMPKHEKPLSPSLLDAECEIKNDPRELNLTTLAHLLSVPLSPCPLPIRALTSSQSPPLMNPRAI